MTVKSKKKKSAKNSLFNSLSITYIERFKKAFETVKIVFSNNIYIQQVIIT